MDGSIGNQALANETLDGMDRPVDGYISRVSVKVPPFWAEQPEIWFVQIESQFSINSITSDQTKFNTVVGHMESRILSQVSDAVVNPPDTDKYGNLKKAIIEQFSDSVQRKMQKMLSGIDLGDKKPSHLYNELKQLGGASVSEEVLKSVWLQRMPPQVTAILAAIKGDVKHLASVADAILDTGAFGNVNQISRAHSQASVSLPVSNESSLSAQIAELTRRFDKLGDHHRRLNNRSSSVKRNRSKSRSNNESAKHDLCWYHFKFGNDADKCKSPCNFSAAQKN